MAGLAERVEAPDPLQGCVGRKPRGLVQQQDSVHVPSGFAARVGGDGAIDQPR